MDLKRKSSMATPSVKVLWISIILSFLCHSGVSNDCSFTNNNHLLVTTPNPIEALNGSCLHVPCNFSPSDALEFDPQKTVVGKWLKTDTKFSNVVFSSDGSTNIYPISFTGDLRQKNCTSLFRNVNKSYEDVYHFRIENGVGKATAACDKVQIKVRDSAWSPELEVPPDLTENQSVTITCSVPTPCPGAPPDLTLSLQQNSSSRIKTNKDGSFRTEIRQTVVLSDSHDEQIINCSVIYPVDDGKVLRTAETHQTLNVSYAPKSISVSRSPSGLVSAGSWVNLTCSCRANPPAKFSWFQISKDGEFSVAVADGAFFRLNVTENGDYYCVAANFVGNQNSTIIGIPIQGSSDDTLMWEAILGGICGFALLAVIAVAVICYRRSHSNAKEDQGEAAGGVAVEEDSKTEEESIHYGEILFSTKTSEQESPKHIHGKELETIYAQVKVRN